METYRRPIFHFIFSVIRPFLQPLGLPHPATDSHPPHGNKLAGFLLRINHRHVVFHLRVRVVIGLATNEV